MSELSLQHLVKIYPFVKVGGTVFGRKRMKELLERQRSQPFTTNEGVLAVRDFSLEVEQGEFIVLLGPSGCGHPDGWEVHGGPAAGAAEHCHDFPELLPVSQLHGL